MSIFNPYSRNSQLGQQQPESSEFISDKQAEEESRTTSNLDYISPEAETLRQVKSGVSDFLGSLNADEFQDHLSPLSPGIQYLSLTDNADENHGALPSRGWSDDLCYGTGTAYLSGLGLGGLWGFVEGSRMPAKNFKIRLNGWLNAMTRRGPFLGNSLGVVALYYSSFYSIVGAMRDGKKDSITSVSAAGITGLLFKVPSGVRASFKAGVTSSILMAVYQLAVNYENTISDFDFRRIKQTA
ncbi:hypothetical protein BB560_001371 [Smittium megazygosporum]|uniref:Mitochondrial import inner membrane translocase subunit TIM23 n=1 Tax=Smittium megazygosporum TaxID=133381 RepID=A0A2T9ZHR8_9FUNG|nr:hypothetical protein BB560_001371 [Smittium megazygosporum]